MMVRRDATLPKLAWYAVIDRRADTCEAEVGRFVEVDPSPFPRWLVSGMWSGDFAAGNFHIAEHVFGSGLRIDDSEVVLVPSHTMLDRIIYAHDGGKVHASNSLVVLLGRMGARLNPETDHRRWGESGCLGVYNYFRQFSVLHPRVDSMNQVMFEAMHLDEKGAAAFRMHDQQHTFRGYDDYLEQLTGAVHGLWKNATDPRRARPMRAATTASRGYDSPTIAALVRPIVGASLISWSSQHSNTRMPWLLQKVMKTELTDDDGSEIARIVGAEPRHLDLNLRDLPAELEAWCWASTETSPELLFHSVLEEADGHDAPTIIFEGHGGDGVWDAQLPAGGLQAQMTRGAPSGVSLAEARVRYGVVDCSPACMFARSVDSIQRISTSDEMAPWRLGNGYDRPICRRILEEKGVPRAAFGWGKKAVAQDLESPQGRELRRLFFQRSRWTRLTERLYRNVNLGLYLGGRLASFLRLRGDRAKMMHEPFRANGKRRLARWFNLQRRTFVLATDLLADRYEAKPAPPLGDARNQPASTFNAPRPALATAE